MTETLHGIIRQGADQLTVNFADVPLVTNPDKRSATKKDGYTYTR